MSCPFVLTRQFYGVGQGLFATGELSYGADECFRWVFDCGTDSGDALLRRRIREFRLLHPEASGERPSIDLVALSHFDRDHVNGLGELLKRFRVGTLLLPYVPFSRRLLLAFDAGIDTGQDMFDFFRAPVGYVANLPGARVDQFVFAMPPDGNETVARSGEGPSLPDLDDGSYAWRSPSDETKGHLVDDGETQLLSSLRSDPSTDATIRFLPPGGRLLAHHMWEFVPYNDAKYSTKADAAFVQAVGPLRRALLEASSPEVTSAAVDTLRAHYDAQFGDSAWMRNAISLFLYSGPVVPLENDPTRCQCQYASADRDYCVGWHEGRDGYCRTLYTGDGYLGTRSRSRALLEFMGEQRLLGVGCMQVMHHGAKNNWHRGLAASIAPWVSVFSSDPLSARFGHPHGDVVRDFLPFAPVQVDKHRSLTMRCGSVRSPR